MRITADIIDEETITVKEVIEIIGKRPSKSEEPSSRTQNKNNNHFIATANQGFRNAISAQNVSKQTERVQEMTKRFQDLNLSDVRSSSIWKPYSCQTVHWFTMIFAMDYLSNSVSIN